VPFPDRILVAAKDFAADVVDEPRHEHAEHGCHQGEDDEHSSRHVLKIASVRRSRGAIAGHLGDTIGWEIREELDRAGDDPLGGARYRHAVGAERLGEMIEDFTSLSLARSPVRPVITSGE
jgi:hypothetical protein